MVIKDNLVNRNRSCLKGRKYLADALQDIKNRIEKANIENR